ncbi:hypothetical protein PG988_012096 [Apiospora saccharicola]
MVVLKTIRRSPAGLCLKAYCLCALVTFFKAAPVTFQLPHLQERLRWLHTRKLMTITLKSWRTIQLPPRDLSLFASTAHVPGTATGVTTATITVSRVSCKDG